MSSILRNLRHDEMYQSYVLMMIYGAHEILDHT